MAAKDLRVALFSGQLQLCSGRRQSGAQSPDGVGAAGGRRGARLFAHDGRARLRTDGRSRFGPELAHAGRPRRISPRQGPDGGGRGRISSALHPISSMFPRPIFSAIALRPGRWATASPSSLRITRASRPMRGYYGIGFIEGLLIWIQKRFYNRVDHAMVPSASVGAMLREWGVTTPTGTWGARNQSRALQSGAARQRMAALAGHRRR